MGKLMSAPLSGQFDSELNQATGMFAGPRGSKAPRGVTRVPQDAAVYVGSAGIYWNQMPAVIGGISGYAGLSTETGSPMGTPAIDSELKNGGGPTTAQVPDLGGTAAYQP
jgi:hypothetical protein